MFCVVGTKEFYGNPPIIKERVVSVHPTKEEAVNAAHEWNPDFDPHFGCCQLSHNQASAEFGAVYRVAEGPCYPDEIHHNSHWVEGDSTISQDLQGWFRVLAPR